jgi:hypothetical protein
MLNTDFNKIWDKTILRLANNFTEKYSNVHFDEKRKENIFKEYEELKNRIHTYMQQEGMLIDRHKIAAIMTFSILRSSPFSLKPSLPTKNALIIEHTANEYLSLAVGLSLIRSFIISECNKNNNMTRKNFFEKQFIFPESNNCHYFIAFIRNLYYSKLNQSVDIFTLANLYFMIESYTELSRKQEMFLNLDPTK